MSKLSVKKMCVFCKLESLAVLFQNEQYALIKDIKPSADHHYLVIPKHHVQNAKYLNKQDVPMIENMKSVALDYIKEIIPDYNQNNLRMGFHWSPFNTVEHLHLHVLYPIESISFIQRQIFRPNTQWFCEVDQTIEILSQKD